MIDISVTLADADGSEYPTVIISGVPTGAVLSAGTDNGDGSWTLTAAELVGLTLTPPADDHSDFTLSVIATSTESVNSDTATTSSAETINVTVSAVNDAPQLTVPGAQIATENEDHLITGISVSDIDAAAGLVSVAISSGGVLTLATTSGLTFAIGDGVEDADLEFSGLVAEVNAALASVTYRGTENDTIVITVSDLGNSGSGGALTDVATIAVTVIPPNTAPTTSGIPDVEALEDGENAVISLFDYFDDLEDLDDEMVYAIAMSSNPSLFESTNIDPLTGELVLDFADDANGTSQVTVRATDSGGLYVESTFDVTVTPVNDAPRVSNLHLENDTDVAGDLITTDATIAGTLADVDSGSYYRLQFDFDGDDLADDTLWINPGSFSVDVSQWLDYGDVEVRVRGVEWAGRDLFGQWESLSFTYEATPNEAPTIEGLALTGVTVEPGNIVYSEPTISGMLVDADTSSSSYYVEVDLDNNGFADDFRYVEPDGTFAYDLTGLVDLGDHTIAVRGVESSPQTGESLEGEWFTIDFTLSEQLATTPTISGLSLVEDTGTPDDLSTTNAQITGVLDASGDGVDYLIEIDVDGDGLSDATLPGTPGQPFTYDPTSLIDAGTVTIAVRGVEWDGLSFLWGDWAELTFEYLGVPNEAPIIADLALVNDTDLPGDGVTSDPRISGSLVDETSIGFDYSIEIDIDGDQVADDELFVTAGDSFEYNFEFLATYGVLDVSLRGVERYVDGSGQDQTVYGDWVDFSFE